MDSLIEHEMLERLQRIEDTLNKHAGIGLFQQLDRIEALLLAALPPASAPA